MLIQYCDTCGLRVPEADLKSGAAIQADENKFFCAKCTAARAPAPRTNVVPVNTEIPTSKSSTPVSAAARVTSRIAPRSTDAAHANASGRNRKPGAADGHAAAQSSRTLMLVGGGAAVVGLMLVIWAATSGKKPQEKLADAMPVDVPAQNTPREPNVSVAKPVEKNTPAAAQTSPAVPGTSTVALNKPAEETKPAEAKRAGGGLFGAMVQDRPSDADADKWRADYAKRLLDEAKKFAQEHADDPGAIRFMYSNVSSHYESLPAGQEAAKLMAEVPAPSGGWTAGYVWREFWLNIPGDRVAELTKNPNYPSKPAGRSKQTALSGPTDCADNYGARIRGYVYPPADGAYTFWIASDDEGQLFLSTDENPANKTMIAHCPHAVGVADWSAQKEQKSAPITLARGKRYYVEVLHKEGGVSDNLAVGWQLPNGNFERPIQGYRLSPFEDGAAPATNVAAVKTEPAAVPPATTVTSAPANTPPAAETSANAAKTDYEQVLADAYVLLARNAVPQVVAKLEEAKANPKFSEQKALLERDVASAHYIEALRKAALAGAAKLADKSAFVLTKNDGREIHLGGKSTVRNVKDETINVDQDLGGGTASMKILIDELNAQTQWELARKGLPAEGESQAKLAFAALVNLQIGKGFLTAKAIGALLDEAEKGHASTEMVKHLRERLAMQEREGAAEAAYHKAEALEKEKKWKEANAAFEALGKEFEGTRTLRTLQAAIVQHKAVLFHELNPAQPGLWTSYWSGDGPGDFKTLHFSRAETKLVWDWGQGSPDPRVPADQFRLRFRGILRIGADGHYRFSGGGDDEVKIWLDGKEIVKNNECDVDLKKGDHDIKVEYQEFGGGASMQVRWKAPGENDWKEIPVEALLHDPSLTGQYEKP